MTGIFRLSFSIYTSTITHLWLVCEHIRCNFLLEFWFLSHSSKTTTYSTSWSIGFDSIFNFRISNLFKTFSGYFEFTKLTVKFKFKSSPSTVQEIQLGPPSNAIQYPYSPVDLDNSLLIPSYSPVKHIYTKVEVINKNFITLVIANLSLNYKLKFF